MTTISAHRQPVRAQRNPSPITHHPSLVLLCAALFAIATPVGAQQYPSRPIRLIVPQSAGGSTDLIARIVAQKMGDALGQTVVVDNRPGAGSLNGTDLVAKATPDGHTLLTVAASFTINPALHKNLPFDPVRDFTPVSQLATLPHILIVHPSVPVKSVKDLIALAKARPGELNVATSGIATSTHMAAELFMYMTGTRMVNVPYKGGAPSIIAMIAGQCQVNFAAISTAIPHVRSGKVRALAVTSAKRSAGAPEHPTVAEAGVPGYSHSSWVGLLAPAKTPRAIISRLNGEAVKAVQMQEVKTVLLRDGLPLSEAQDLLSRRRDELDPDIIRYIEASAGHALAMRNRALKRARMVDADGNGLADGVVLIYTRRINHRRDTDGRYPFRVRGYKIRRIARARRSFKLKIFLEEDPSAPARPPIVYRRTRRQPDGTGSSIAIAQRR